MLKYILRSISSSSSNTNPSTSTKPDTHTRQGRQLIAADTVERTPAIIASTPGASPHSTFYNEETCPAIDPSSRPEPPHARFPVLVVNSDSFTAARGMLQMDPTCRVVVLNLASDELPGGGWLHTLSRTQEEALCYSSTLYNTLKPEWYPWSNLGPGSVAGIFSPAIVVFKNDLDRDCVDLPENERTVVSVITVAAPRHPALNESRTKFAKEEDVRDLRGKIRIILRIAVRNKQDSLVLGAMGCGAYGCPPVFVANEMKAILLEDEFQGWFKNVMFAVYSSAVNGPSNFKTFREAYKGFEMNL